MPPPNNKSKPTAPAAVKQYHAPTVHLLTRIIALIDEMIAVMDEEIPMVENRKREQHAELLKRKQRLTLDYRASLKAIVMEPELLKQVPDELRAEARAAADRLAEASGRNGRTLRAIMTASQRLVQSIVTMVREEVLPKPGYAHVLPGHKEGGYSPTCKPVTVYKTA
jgi:flagellar biosynthesis/type III secretory pathway chaperone